MHVMHFAADDIGEFRERLVSLGIDCLPVKAFERDVDTPDGKQMMKALAFSFPQGANPEGLIQVAQHLTAELVLQPRYMHHPNGARAVTESIVCASDPGRYAEKHGQYTATRPKAIDKGWYEVDFGNGSRITIVAPEQVANVVPNGAAPADPALVGFVVAVERLDTVGNLLARNGVSFDSYRGRLVVEAVDACGSAVIFDEIQD
jgi:hypothetical protein